MSALIPRLIDLAIAIQQIPAPTFHEAERAEFVRQQFLMEGLADVTTDSSGSVFARLAGSGSSRPLVVSAHLDTVFPPGTDLKVEREPERILGPGLGDNALGVAGLIGLVWALREGKHTLPGDLWLAANTCEEGLGNLNGMRLVVERFGSSPLAYIVLEGMALGQLYHRGLGVQRYRITVRTPGGHSWIDYGQPSAIHEMTALSTAIAGLEMPRTPRTTLNIGIISGGSSINTIAAEAMLELDLRSESPEVLAGLVARVEDLVRQAQKPGVAIEAEVIGRRPAGGIPTDHPLVKHAQACISAVGIGPRLNTGSTDANLPLSLGLPCVTIGLTSGGRAHSIHEFINLPPLKKGLDQLLMLVSAAWQALETLPGG